MELLFPAFIFLAIYFIPTGIAANRQHPQFGAICALNILLGWTFIGWVAALVWALITTHRPLAQPVCYREVEPGKFVPLIEYQALLQPKPSELSRAYTVGQEGQPVTIRTRVRMLFVAFAAAMLAVIFVMAYIKGH